MNHPIFIYTKNVFVILVILLALYFSITSIIAIPIVNDQSNIDNKLSEKFKVELTTYSEGDSSLNEKYIEFIESKKKLTDNDNKDSLLIQDVFFNSKIDVNLIFRELEQAEVRVIERMKHTDHSGLNLELGRKDRDSLSVWYLKNRDRLISNLNVKLAEINNFTSYILKGGDINDSTFYEPLYMENSEKFNFINLPKPPEPGSDLGIFNMFTGWLFNTGSSSLVIIIGLIGFGLLGAAGSTFIREREKNDQKALIDDFTGVLVKGFTAAIVVFLGVQGGLSILTTDPGDLNSHALFFVTFVAAVFSDEAWGWAKKRFINDFNSDDNPPAN